MTVVTVIEHDAGCSYGREGRGGHSDAAKRVADTYMLHRTAGAALGLSNVGKVFAVSLQDGTSDGQLYDTLAEAIRHQKHSAKWYAYLRVGRHALNPCEASSLMQLHRDADKAGLNFTGRHDPPLELIPRLTAEDHHRMRAAMAAGTIRAVERTG